MDFTFTVQEIKKLTPYLDDIEPKLTVKQRCFAYYFVMNGFNGADACRKSGYIVRKGKNENVQMTVQAVQNLHKLNIKESVKRIINNAIKDKKEMEKRLFDSLFNRAFYDIETFQNNDGTFKNLNEIPLEWHCCIDNSEIKYYGKDADTKVLVMKLADRDKAIDKLDKYIQMTKDTVLVDTITEIIIKKSDGNIE